MSAAIGPKPQIFRIDPAEVSPGAIREATSILRSGGLVLYPTETFYAVGAAPEIAEAVRKIFEIKGREPVKPLPLIASDFHTAKRAASQWPESADALAGAFWPGPLSIIIPAAASLPFALHAGTGKIAVRVSSHRVASLLADTLGGLIVSTSANRAGGPPPASPLDIDAGLLASVAALLDAGNLPGGLPSTIVDVTVHPATLVRAGKITLEDIRRALEPRP